MFSKALHALVLNINHTNRYKIKHKHPVKEEARVGEEGGEGQGARERRGACGEGEGSMAPNNPVAQPAPSLQKLLTCYFVSSCNQLVSLFSFEMY